jgi:tripeptide aminopeptidase
VDGHGHPSPANGLVDLFLELCSIPSPPGEERAMADRVGAELTMLGLSWDEDETAAETGSTAGNLYCQIPATAPGTPLFLCAHLDTVPLDGRLDPVVEEGVVRNTGGTILGADNKAAVVAMLEGVRRVLRDGRPHAGIELVFTTMEEVGLRGAYAFDHTRLQAKVGFVYDQQAPIGAVVASSPWQRSLRARFHGRAAHAGMVPEEGRSAIQAAARAIADLRLGRIDAETTANIGLIDGGTARNIVPEWCALHGEARSQDERRLSTVVQEMLDTLAFAAATSDCTLETDVTQLYAGYRLDRSASAVVIAFAALEAVGVSAQLVSSGGGADANVFNARGRTCANLANGMAEIHTPDEHITVDDLELMADVTVSLLDAALEA